MIQKNFWNQRLIEYLRLDILCPFRWILDENAIF